MYSTTYTSTSQHPVTDALKDLGTATRALMVALAQSVSARDPNARSLKHRVKEAAQARRLAFHWAQHDHRVAADIFCAADRHEQTAD